MKIAENIAEEYREQALAHGHATIAGDYKKTNKAHDKLVAIVSDLKGLGEPGLVVLRRMLADENDSVASWSATHLLMLGHDDGVETLERIAKKFGPVAFSAGMVVDLWKKGELQTIF